MRINIHTHVFNLKSAITKEAVEVFLSRLDSQKLPKYLTAPLNEFLNRALQGDIDEEMSENNAFAKILSKVSRHSEFQKISGKELGKKLADEIEKIVPVTEPGASLSILKGVFSAIIMSSPNETHKDAINKTITDFIDFLRINFLPSVDAVTDDLVRQSGPDDTLVVLPMDIIGAKASKKDRAVYLKQLDATIDQCFRYPGKILPFIKVNPIRGEEAYTIFDKYTKSGACIGVKLYPSLGYDVDTPFLRKIYKFCESRSLPVLLHCNDAGFRKSLSDGQRCNPSHWVKILADFPKLKVCFGHFGGDENLVKSSNPTGWTQTILEMMEKFPGQVYADISFHTRCMKKASSPEYKNYKKNLKAILKHKVCKKYVLWGTDYFLVRQQLEDSSYIRYFENMLTNREMENISLINPKRFIGIPSTSDELPAPNIHRHLGFLSKNTSKLGDVSTSWIRMTAAGTSLKLSQKIEKTNWDQNNLAHSFVKLFLWSSKLHSAVKIPSYIPDSIRKELKAMSKSDRFHTIGQLRMGELAFHMKNPGSGNHSSNHQFRFIVNLYNVLTSKYYAKAKPKSSEYTKTYFITKMRSIVVHDKALVSSIGNLIGELYDIPN